ncbi:UbiA prenyltransferase family-domain-containing protein [Pelagophyceae sp. CCMP2097]|nr:UbiA prenyltransferase family-domain-containing protein [Pelagophyceae sp. CCMP2097]
MHRCLGGRLVAARTARRRGPASLRAGAAGAAGRGAAALGPWGPRRHSTGSAAPEPPRVPRSKLAAFAALARADRPEGTLLLLWPGAWSIALAAPAGAAPDLHLLALFTVGAFAMRGAGCTINDMWDRDFDARVERTKERPLAAKELTVWPEATLFLGAQLTAGLAVLTQLNHSSILLGCASVPLVGLYPLAKRFTRYPQLVLGATFNWGAMLGYCAATGSADLAVCAPLYAGCVAWTFFYDTLYAHQDKQDDKHLGLHSSALTLADQTKPVLAVCAAAAVLGIAAAGHNAGLNLGEAHAVPFYASLGCFGAQLGWQLYTADLDDPANLAARFRSNAHVAPVVLAGISASTYLHPLAVAAAAVPIA